MTVIPSAIPVVSNHIPWNKGKIVGAKPPLRPKHVWSIRTKLQVEGRKRDLALFNVAIETCGFYPIALPHLGRRESTSNA
jgi:hypothetical protein